MAVVIETTLGDITVDLYLDQRPVTCLNFLKLCKMKYYNFNLFHTIRSGFIAQTGDPSGEGSGGQSIFGLLEGPDKRFFSGEKMPKIRHTDVGQLSMVGTGDMMIGSQFFFTLGSDLDSLDGIHCVIGEVTEGHDVLRKLNDVICDEGHRPYRDVRITHTVVLEDPFNDPLGLRAPSRSPSPSAERLKGGRIAPDEEIDETQGKSAAEIQEMIEEKEAKARATILEIVGDLPDADIAPPENVLFVCKLNPITNDDDLEIIFSRFGKIVTCEVIRDKKTGDSLQYAFIEFADKKSCEDAYFKMDNVLIDDRRIHVDFSQSVSKMKWLGKGRGVKHFNDEEAKMRERENNIRNNKPLQHRYKDGEHSKHYNDRNQDTNNKRSDDRERDRDVEKRSERHQRREKETNHKTDEKSQRRRSRSRSRSKVDRPRNDRNNHSNNRNGSRNSDRSVKEYRNESNRYENVGKRDNSPDNNVTKNSDRNNKEHKRDSNRQENERNRIHSNDHVSRKTDRNVKDYKQYSDRHEGERNRVNTEQSVSRNSERNIRDYKEESREERNKDNSNVQRSKPSPSLQKDGVRSGNAREYKSRHENNDRREVTENSKLKHKNEHVESVTVKQPKSGPKNVEPRTPTPTNSKKKVTSTSKHSEKMKEKCKRNAKKKRKPSTSSDSSSDSTSSSSESSSSSDANRKKKSVKRRKKKYSTSSTSSSDSSTSSSSSSSESSSSSSTSEDTKRRKTAKRAKKVL